MVQQLGQMMPQIFHALAAEPEPLKTLDNLRQVNVPALFFHGDQDEISPVGQAVTAHRSCASSAKKLVRYRNAHHNDVRLAARRDYYAHMKLLQRIVSGEVPADELTVVEETPGMVG